MTRRGARPSRGSPRYVWGRDGRGPAFRPAGGDNVLEHIHEILHQQFRTPVVDVVGCLLDQHAAGRMLREDQQDAIPEAPSFERILHLDRDVGGRSGLWSDWIWNDSR